MLLSPLGEKDGIGTVGPCEEDIQLKMVNVSEFALGVQILDQDSIPVSGSREEILLRLPNRICGASFYILRESVHV